MPASKAPTESPTLSAPACDIIPGTDEADVASGDVAPVDNVEAEMSLTELLAEEIPPIPVPEPFPEVLIPELPCIVEL